MYETKLVHEIAGKKYLLVEIPTIEGQGKRVEEFIERNGLIFQGVKSIDRGGLFGRAVVVGTYFLPEQNFISYSRDKI